MPIRVARGANPSLEANAFTAFAPNPKLGHMIGHATVGTARSIWRNLKLLVNAKSTPVVHDGLRPPADVPAGQIRNQPVKHPDAMARSRETPWDLPQLPLDLIDDAERYSECTTLASRPWPTHNGMRAIPHAPNASDAFTAEVTDQGNRTRKILPDSIRQSTLLNRAGGAYDELKDNELGFKQSNVYPSGKPVVGMPNSQVLSHLHDPKTGFSAGITYDPDRREVVIGFSGLGSAKSTFPQLIRCILSVTGLFVPKNMSQASKLAKQTKAHIDALNQDLPPDQQIKLTLTGHSMGGGLASYAALRAKVPAVVFNPMRLGLAARACIGQKAIDQADKYLTEIVSEGDWVADSSFAKAYIPSQMLGLNNRGPIGNARRYMVPNFNVEDPHSDVGKQLANLRTEHQDVQDNAPQLWRHLQSTSPRALGALRGGRTRVAIKEALVASAKQHDVRLTWQEANDMSRMAEKLIRGKNGPNPLLEKDGEKLFKDLKGKIARIRDGRKMFPALQALADDIFAQETKFKPMPQDLNIVDQRAGTNVNKRGKASKLLGDGGPPQTGRAAARNNQGIVEDPVVPASIRNDIEDEVLDYGSTGSKLNGLLVELGIRRADLDIIKLNNALIKSVDTINSLDPEHIKQRVAMMIQVNVRQKAALSANGDAGLQQADTKLKGRIEQAFLNYGSQGDKLDSLLQTMTGVTKGDLDLTKLDDDLRRAAAPMTASHMPEASKIETAVKQAIRQNATRRHGIDAFGDDL